MALGEIVGLVVDIAKTLGATVSGDGLVGDAVGDTLIGAFVGALVGGRDVGDTVGAFVGALVGGRDLGVTVGDTVLLRSTTFNRKFPSSPFTRP